jgi:hypothetical protein
MHEVGLSQTHWTSNANDIIMEANFQLSKIIKLF